MSTTKKDKRQVIAIIALLIVIVTVSGFGMYAWGRYQIAVNGTAQAQIAKWSFKVNRETEKIETIDLVDTMTSVDTSKIADRKIAPGTKGKFTLELDGSGSEVGIDYYIKIDVNKKPTNLVFYKDSGSQNKEQLNLEGKIVREGSISLEDINTLAEETIYWEWPYETTTKTTTITKRENDAKEEKMVSELTKVAEKNKITLTGTEIAEEILEKLNTAAGDDEEKIIEINDAIDTAENGIDVKIPIEIVAEQMETIEPELKYTGLQIVNNKTTYTEGEEIELEAVFSENVYGGTRREAITAENAPVLTVEFTESTVARNKAIAEVATITNSNIRIATVDSTSGQSINSNTARFVRASGNKIQYAYTVKESNKGQIKIASFTGNVYNKRGKVLSEGKSEITGENVQVENIAFAQGETVITSDTSKIYKRGDTIAFEINFNKNVYGGIGETVLTAENAPVLTIGFSDITETRTATFAGVEGSKIKYEYRVVGADNGKLSINGYTGKVYSKYGTELTVAKKVIEGTEITVEGDLTIGKLTHGDYIDIGKNLLNTGEVMYSQGTYRAEWRVVKVEGGKVQLILSDYLPTSNITNASIMGMSLNSNGYTVAWPQKTADEAVATLTNSSNWTHLLTGSKLANKSGVTITGALTYNDIPTGTDKSNTIFYPHSSNFNGCWGYFLATKYNDLNLRAAELGTINGKGYRSSTFHGLRPVIEVDSNLIVESIGTNAYSVVSDQ